MSTVADFNEAWSVAAAADAAARSPLLTSLTRIRTLGASNEVRVIAYGVYGDDPR